MFSLLFSYLIFIQMLNLLLKLFEFLTYGDKYMFLFYFYCSDIAWIQNK